ncbi:MAG TPA: CBS domain-containing protein [Casimicrobiaceae bacterium]|nr:CBS domain-containing protein [Casimicrobiaceae bacterium]
MSFESLRTVLADHVRDRPAIAATATVCDAVALMKARHADAAIAHALVLMDDRGCDHVAVADRGRVLGVLSRGDLDA